MSHLLNSVFCCDMVSHIASGQLYWPLTKRGLFSELLVFAYCKSVLEYHGSEVQLISSFRDIYYWRSILPSFTILPSVFPSSILSPVSPLPGPMFFLANMPIVRTQFYPKLLLSYLWSPEVEQSYTSKFNLLAKMSSVINQALLPYSGSFDFEAIALEPFSNYNVVHLRRGDKVFNPNPEACLTPLDSYLSLAKKNFSQELPVIIIGDNRSDIMALETLLRKHGFLFVHRRHPVQTAGKYGYNQIQFNRLSLQQRITYNQSFIYDFLLMTKSLNLVCSYSSCVGRSAAVVRGLGQTYSVDTSFSIVQ